MRLPHPRYDFLYIRQTEGFKLRRREFPTPRVKYLYSLCTIVCLVAYIVGNTCCQLLEQRVKDEGVCKGHLLDNSVVLGTASLNNIRCQGPWSPYKAEDCGLLRSYLISKGSEGLSNEGHALVRVQMLHRLHLSQTAYRGMDDWASSFHDIEVHIHAG
eukprot:scaffold1672_cov366-Prasinococcus_capsulatus_cf.AAC.2